MKSSLWNWKVLLLACAGLALVVGLAWLPAQPADAGGECTECEGPEQTVIGSGFDADCNVALDEARQDAFDQAATGGCIPCDTFELSECYGSPGAWNATVTLYYKCQYCDFSPERPPGP